MDPRFLLQQLYLRRIGHVQANNTMAILDVSPIPSSNINTGSKANAAVFRNNSNTGFNSSLASGYQPINNPNGIAITNANEKPLIERMILAKNE